MQLLQSNRFYTVLIFLFCLTASAQTSKYNRWSLEATTGIHVPLAPNEGVTPSEYIAFKQFQLAGRYMFTNKLGLKGHYAFNRFANPNDKEMGVSFNRFGLEGVANVGKLLKLDYRLAEKVGLLFHTGLGVTFAKPSSVEGTDHQGNILVGFTGEIQLNRRFTLLGDITYVHTSKQHYTYSGLLLDPNYAAQPGGIVNVSFGIMFDFGEANYHADWY